MYASIYTYSGIHLSPNSADHRGTFSRLRMMVRSPRMTASRTPRDDCHDDNKNEKDNNDNGNDISNDFVYIYIIMMMMMILDRYDIYIYIVLYYIHIYI